MTGDPFHLQRFVDAQDAGGTYQRAAAELRRHRKTSHWMWFVFPQLAGLGSSAMSRRYALSGIAEAVAYRGHPVLGPRLLEVTSIVAGATDTSAEQIFGGIDAQKLHSSMTLFARAVDDAPFREVLDAFFGGHPDSRTDQLLAAQR